MYDTESIKNSAHLLSVVSNDMGSQGKRSGHITFFVCPFHQEKTGSLAVYDNRNFWKCYGCGKSGDVISWVQLFNNMSFLDACKTLGGDYHTSPQSKPFVPTGIKIAPSVPEMTFTDKAETLVKMFHKELLEPTSDDALTALLWLEERGIGKKDVIE